MTRETIYFLGITTGGSAVRKVFPAWMDLLGVDADLKTVDVPAGSPAEPYRNFLTQVRDEPTALGAVITAHKTAIFQHGQDLFAQTDPDSQRFEEISVISRVPGGLRGTVIEHHSIATTLAQMGGGTPFTGPDRDVVVFGAGGTAVSLIATLTAESWPDEHRPRKLHLVDVSADRLQHAHDLATTGAKPLCVNVLHTQGDTSLSYLGDLPPHTLIVNATGLGKDKPGAPFTLPAPWPEGAHVWDLNYRGDLLMLDEARRVAAERHLDPQDGWLLFINGWAESLSRIVGRPIDDDERAEMNRLAQQVRS
jgi:shikimate 5-dehydrogenase